MPELHVVAGPNGAGKTTCFKLLVPKGIDYINADLIAKTIKEKAGGLNTQDIANQEAASIFWNKVTWQKSFAIETNLHDVETYKSFQALQAKGYKIIIYFVGVEKVEICIERVKKRVLLGGHNVNPDVIKERYTRGLALLKHFKNFPDILILLDNTDGDLNLQSALYRGFIVSTPSALKNWVKEIISESSPKVRPLESKSIEEIRRLYQKDKGKS